MKGLYCVLLLTLSNVFMTLAWYGHLQLKQYPMLTKLSLVGVIILSWGLAFFEYIFQVPANRIGSDETGGPFSLFQLKTIQEAVSLLVFTLITVYILRSINGLEPRSGFYVYRNRGIFYLQEVVILQIRTLF